MIQYVDDLLIVTKDHHVLVLETLLVTFMQRRLKVNLSKAQLGKKEVHFGGLILQPGGKSPDHPKLRMISTLPMLALEMGLRQFLQDFSTRAYPRIWRNSSPFESIP